jgi:4-alpha-glucanotransferase
MNSASAPSRARRATPRRSAAPFRFDRRASGLLMHPTSLPGPHGSGDLGPAAHAFIDFLAQARQRWWQMLPVGPPGPPPGNGPYGSTSAFAGSVWLISPDLLREDGLLDRADLTSVPRASEHAVNYRAMYRHRGRLLRRAFARFERDRARHDALDAFRAREKSWLDDFTLFSALRDHLDGRPWLRWPRDVKLRQPQALARARGALAAEIRFHEFCQLAFDQQWLRLRAHTHANRVGLIGDIPIFVALDSCDVWAHPALFMLDRSGRPQYVSGAPPDDFCPDGQLWGHPQYRWDAHRASGFAWWVARFASMMRRFDGVRIDHFLGFLRAWAVPAGARTARRGTWLAGPGGAIFDAVRKALGDVPIIAEDLGVLTPAAAALRDRMRFPGMRVMQFGFGAGGEYHLPHRYPRRAVAYTGTHDNNTTAGWFADLVRRNGHPGSALSAERDKAMKYLEASNAAHVPWQMIRAAMASVADTVIFPVQDLLGLGEEARMNVPGVAAGQWQWRLPPGKLTPALASRLRRITELYERA